MALGVLLAKGLGNATVYFRTADEAVAQRSTLGSRRFRIEGVVAAGSVRQVGAGVAFAIAGKETTVEVLHHGDPPQLFKPGIPVVLEGKFEADHFSSDRMMVKHSETYVARHPGRLTPPAGQGTQ